MTRRGRKRATGMSALLMIALLACSPRPGEDKQVGPPPKRDFDQDWVVLYWIPYDNDLAAFAEPVLDELKSARSSERVVIVAQIDRPGNDGMVRVVHQGSHGEEHALPDVEDSASIHHLRGYLHWAAQRFESRRYALVFLNHGGGVSQLGLDEHPSSGSQQVAKWQSLPEVARALEDFGGSERGTLDLVYMQVCVKATLESAYELRSATPHLLASQLPVFAPNRYYEGTFAALAEDPGMDGAALGRTIARSEHSEMYASLSLIHTRGIDQVASSFVAAMGSAGPRGDATVPGTRLPTYAYWTDRYIDLLAVTESRQGSAGSAAVRAALADTVEVFVAPRAGRLLTSPAPEDLSGLSVHLPLRGELLPGYDDLEIYRDTSMLDGLRPIAVQQDEIRDTPPG